MKIQDSRFKIQNFLLLTAYCLLLTASGCGYHMVGSTSLPFHTVTIKPVLNKTYEPRLEDVLHNALSREFISHGINVTSTDTKANGAVLETVITSFSINTIAVSGDMVKEQSVVMHVDFRLIENKRVMEFRSVRSPITITFQTTGSVAESVVEKERAVERASAEITKELVSRIVLRYVR